MQEYKHAREHFSQAVSLAGNMGNIERFACNVDRAMELYRESLLLKQALGDWWAVAYTLDGCAAIATSRGEGRNAARLFGAAASIRDQLGAPLERKKVGEHDADVAAPLSRSS